MADAAALARLEPVPARYFPHLLSADFPRQAPANDYLLILRFALLNLIGFALVGLAHIFGLIEMVVAADRTGLCLVIAAVFVLGLGICADRAWRMSRELNLAQRGELAAGSEIKRYVDKVAGRDVGSRSIFAGNLRLRLTHRISIVRQAAGSLVLLGLIGTVIGFIIALSGIEPNGVSDVNAVGPMVSTLIAGMSTALYTTLVGSVLNIWLMINYSLLVGGTVKLTAAVTEFGETHGAA